jgi:predicted TIM-barrel fold metal-dependent hydrolase
MKAWRRHLINRALSGTIGAPEGRPTPFTSGDAVRVDVHCHIAQRCRRCGDEHRFSFEPVSRTGDAYLSDWFVRSMGMRLARHRFDFVPRPGPASVADDDRLEARLLRHILDARRIDRVVLLALDQYHTDDGEPRGPRADSRTPGTDLYVSNTYIRELCRRHPGRLLLGASIHPYRLHGRMTAVDMLREATAAGAALVKWLPTSQNIDPEDPRTVEFMREAARLGLPLLVHTAEERALGSFHRHLERPDGLLRTLARLRQEGLMPTTIVAHVATSSFWPITSHATFNTLIAALTGPFADAPLYADVAALCLFNKAHWLRRIVRMPGIHHKLVYGSDFPLPPSCFVFRRLLGERYHEVVLVPSWIDRDVIIKSCVGLPSEVFSRGGELLARRIDAASSRPPN